MFHRKGTKRKENRLAKRTTVELTDDLDGTKGPGVQTVKFGWLGIPYEVDLSERHREEFALKIGRYLQAGRPARARNPKSRTDAQRAQSGAIRVWALANGLIRYDKGRISGAVIDAYWAAHEDTETGTEH
jgi:nucleoid-associated protein Lsr2